MLKTIQNLDVYAFSLCILALIALKSTNSKNGNTAQAKAFSILVLCNILIIIDDSISVFFDGWSVGWVRPILIASAIIGYALQILICFFWFWYAQLIALDERRPRKGGVALEAAPAAIGILLTIVSAGTGWIFSYDAVNVYHRGPYFLFIPIMSYLYIAVGYAMIIKFRRNIERKYLRAMLCFALPPFIGGILQTLFYGTSLIWSGTTISLLIIYIAIQNELILFDHLTGLNNRMSFDRTLKRRIAGAKPSKPFALILVDLNDFRAINDHFGHIEGDEALKATAGVLKNFFRKKGFVARFGGDEFAVLYEFDKLSSLSGIQDRMEKDIDTWNASRTKQWKLSISVGYAPYITSDRLTADQFVMQVDKLLSLDKIAPKNGHPANRRRR